MKKHYLNLLIGLFMSLLIGCQSVTSSRFFNIGYSDEALAASVSAALTNNTQLASIPIHVTTQQGTVTLSGYVKTIRQSDTAGDIAAKVSGVKAVRNELIVRK